MEKKFIICKSEEPKKTHQIIGLDTGIQKKKIK